MTGISLLSLSDKSAVDVVGELDVDCATRYWVILLFLRHPAAGAGGGWWAERPWRHGLRHWSVARGLGPATVPLFAC